jgi:hypothetical protein
MDGVGIVQQRRAEKRKTCVEQKPQAGNREDYFPAGNVCSDIENLRVWV